MCLNEHFDLPDLSILVYKTVIIILLKILKNYGDSLNWFLK